MTTKHPPNHALTLLDEFVAEGREYFSHAEAAARTGQSPSATSNLLRRMTEQGLLDRVRRGQYVIRRFGVLGTAAAAESVPLAVGAAFAGELHRIAYRSALDLHDLIPHPSRTIQVAVTVQIRMESLSARPVRLIREADASIGIGAVEIGPSWMSDLERALLDAANRPRLVGGSSVVAEALSAASSKLDTSRLVDYARTLGSSAGLRRLGSLADTLRIAGIADQLQPLSPPTGDIPLEPGVAGSVVWRDARWRVRWLRHPDEILQEIHR